MAGNWWMLIIGVISDEVETVIGARGEEDEETSENNEEMK